MCLEPGFRTSGCSLYEFKITNTKGDSSYCYPLFFFFSTPFSLFFYPSLYSFYFGFLFIRAMCLCAKWDSDSPTISNQDLINGVLSLLLFFFSPEFFFALPDISMNFLLQKSLGLSTRTRIYAWMHVMYQRDLVPF